MTKYSQNGDMNEHLDVGIEAGSANLFDPLVSYILGRKYADLFFSSFGATAGPSLRKTSVMRNSSIDLPNNNYIPTREAQTRQDESVSVVDMARQCWSLLTRRSHR